MRARVRSGGRRELAFIQEVDVADPELLELVELEVAELLDGLDYSPLPTRRHPSLGMQRARDAAPARLGRTPEDAADQARSAARSSAKPGSSGDTRRSSSDSHSERRSPHQRSAFPSVATVQSSATPASA